MGKRSCLGRNVSKQSRESLREEKRRGRAEEKRRERRGNDIEDHNSIFFLKILKISKPNFTEGEEVMSRR